MPWVHKQSSSLVCQGPQPALRGLWVREWSWSCWGENGTEDTPLFRNMWLPNTEVRKWEAWQQQIGAKRRAEGPLVPWQVVLAEQITGVCCQYCGHIVMLEVTWEQDRKSYRRHFYSVILYTLQMETLSLGIRSHAENFSMTISF